MVKNIISDIGNVLYEFGTKKFIDTYVEENDKEMFFSKIFGSINWNLMDKGEISFEDSRKYFISVCKNYEDTLNKLFDSCLMLCLSKNNNNIDLLKKCKEKGYNIYYLSNMPKETFEVLKKDTDFFNKTCSGGIISADINMIKPNKDIYEYFLNKFNIIAEECLFIDDNINNVNSAIELGINSMQLKNINDMHNILESILNN